jgi:hypothetical protein
MPSSWPIGLALLANSRPYEGLIFSLPIAAALAIWMFGKSHPAFSVSFSRVGLPMVLVLAASGAGMGYYYWRVTGSPFRMTYQVNRETYATAPYFLWESPRPEPAYRHEVMRDFLSLGTGPLRGIPHPGRRRQPHMGQGSGFVEVLLRTAVHNPAAGFPLALARQENALSSYCRSVSSCSAWLSKHGPCPTT